MQINIDGVSISFSGVVQGVSAPSKKRSKPSAAANGVCLLDDADLKLKEGKQYNLVGRNGTGKSCESSRKIKHATSLLTKSHTMSSPFTGNWS